VKLPKAPAQLLDLTFRLLASGQLKEAHRVCRKAIQARPDVPEAHLLLSEIHHQGGDSAKARESASRALRLRPGWSEAHVALGNAEVLAANLTSAEEHFRAAIAAGSPSAGVHANLGHVLMRQGRLEEAREAYELAASRDPNSVELQLNVAMILSELGQKPHALDVLTAVAERFPQSSQVAFALGNALADLGRNDEAVLHYRRALERDPAFSAALFNLALALNASRRNDEAIAALYELLRRNPAATDAREHLLRVLHASRRYREMEAVAREGLAIHPTELLYARQVAVALWWQERHDDAIAAFEAIDRSATHRRSPAYREAKLEYGTSLLALGRWREGWEGYGWRSVRNTWRVRFPKLVDDPRAIAALEQPARILIIGEQGLGDEIFFLRFARRLRDRGHRLCGGFDERLLALFAGIPGLFDELTSVEKARAIEADATILSGDLPLATAQDFAPPLVLSADAARIESFDARLREFGPPPYIGVTWRAGFLPSERVPGTLYLAKEVKPEELGTLLRPLRATFVILQRRPSPEDEQRFVAALGRPALDLSAVNDDLHDALAVLSILDDYVALSNTNTHLRAAVPGKTARVLVPPRPEWRWGLGTDLSPWFPEFRIYRESLQAGWAPAFEALALDLARSTAAQQHDVG
jgi:tetratricopeptide (TPR) repeat protein